MAKLKKKIISEGLLHTLKKCPYCFTMLKLDADRCDHCKHRVGPVNKAGFAQKPINWKAYLLSILAWSAFVIYIWWAFFKK